jgi:hypothetical protein
MVRAPRSVWTASTVFHFPPRFSVIVNVPSPLELNARSVPESYSAGYRRVSCVRWPKPIIRPSEGEQ